LIPSYLILAEASLGLKQLNQCWEYLSQAQYTVLQQSEQAPLSITSQLARNMAQLSIARKEYDEATRHLANDVCILLNSFSISLISFRFMILHFIMVQNIIKLLVVIFFWVKFLN
jgi:hypothetical protein